MSLVLAICQETKTFPALERMDNKQQEDHGFPTAVSEQELEARRKSVLSHIFGSSSIFRSPGTREDRPDLRADLIIANKAIAHYENGEEAMTQCHFPKAVTCFSKAINLQPKQTKLYVRQAEAYLQMCDFQSAANCYRQACLLEPQAFHVRLAFIYYLQGQCLYDQGMFLEALESYTKATKLKPSCRSYHMRSLACLTALRRYSDCLQLVSNWLEDSQTADLFTLRARLHQQLKQVRLCYHDLKSALALNPTCPEAGELLRQLEEASERARQAAVCKALAGELPEALYKINTALEHCPEKGHHYLFRGIIYRRLKDFMAAIEDLVLAVELSEAEERERSGGGGGTLAEPRAVQRDAEAQLVLTYNDFALQCFSRGFYAEATTLLTKAIEEEKAESGLYINRGDCFFQQAEWEFALADYQQAEEMAPDDQAIWVRLALVFNTLGTHSYQDRKYQQAIEQFSLAIKYNPRASQYYESRGKAQRNVSNMEGAKPDAISALILDPTNDQVVPLLLSLFPGCSVSDVLSSETARSVKAQLMDNIQACSDSSVLRLCGGLDKMVLTHDPDSQLEDTSDPGEGPKPAVAKQELFKEMDRSNQQVKQAVRLALQHRLPLNYDGPRLAPVRPVEQEQAALSSEARPYHWRNFGRFGVNST